MARRKSNRRKVHMRHDMSGQPDTLLYAPPKIVHQGITPRGYFKPPTLPPMTPQQEATLVALTGEPQRASAIARATGRSPSGAVASLMALEGRGLAQKIKGRWRLAP